MLLNNLRVYLLEEFTRDYSLRLTGSSLAKKKHLNQKSVANALREFEEDGFLKSIPEGRNKVYLLNIQDTKIIENVLSMIEHIKTINFYKKNPVIKEIAEKITPFCEGIVLIFGSYAKNTHKEDSDVDILIIGTCKEKKIQKISEVYNREINAKMYPLPVFRKSLHEPVIEEIKKDHIIILNTEQFVKEMLHGED